MRIVGGTHRGVPLIAPAGQDTRPTTDRMRETVANIILARMDFDLSDLTVLDAFAGSGAMGLELLSRGAAHAILCEKDEAALSAIEKNITKVREVSATTVYRGDVQRFAEMVPARVVDVVYLDPPYRVPTSEVASLITKLSEHHLAVGALIVYEHAGKDDPLELERFETVRSKRYGTTLLDVLKYSGSEVG